jgi:signal transduction histidine kinase
VEGEPGQGATFWFTLPRAHAALGALESAQSA